MNRNRKVEVVGFLGLGLDDANGHRRVTTGGNFLLVGGSEETHERLVDTAIHLNEALGKRGKLEMTPEELRDLFDQVAD